MLKYVLRVQWKGGFDIEAKNAAESDTELETLQVHIQTICMLLNQGVRAFTS
jgi:hypothetical protein